MAKKEHIVRYTDKELREMRERGEDKSDWKKAASMTNKEIEAAIAGDEDEKETAVDRMVKNITQNERCDAKSR